MESVNFAHRKPQLIDSFYTVPNVLSGQVWLCILGSFVAMFITSIMLRFNVKDVMFSAIEVALMPIVAESIVIRVDYFRYFYKSHLTWTISGSNCTFISEIKPQSLYCSAFGC